VEELKDTPAADSHEKLEELHEALEDASDDWIARVFAFGSNS
jgi:hypothetical protein